MDLEKEVDQLKKRNARVEAEKAWETSWTRRLIVFGLTYFVIVVFLFISGLPRPFVNAIIPAVAFFLSTATVPLVKKIWLRRR